MPQDICFRCKTPISKPAAYITDAHHPVCNNCLNTLIEGYFWEKENGAPHRIQRRKLKAFAQRSLDEIYHELGFYLATIPSIIERGGEITSSPTTKLMRLPEMRSIPLLRGA